jgi:alanine dehydrogenase
MVLILNEKEVERVLDMKIAIKAVEEAFREMGEGKVEMPPRVPVFLEEYDGAIGFMPAYLKKSKILGIKVMSHYEKNPERFKRPILSGLIILNDPETGIPFTIMDAAFVTIMRTGAAGAVGAKYLSREDSEIVGVIGTGKQGISQVLALNEVRKVKKVKAYNISKEAQLNFLRALRDRIDAEIELVDSPENAVRGADIVVTCTPSTQPIVRADWLAKGVHITAIGADMPKKRELHTEVFKILDKIVVDSIAQVIPVGEFRIPISEGVISKESIYAEIGEIVAGKKAGRESNKEITLFKSTGLAIQDISTAYKVYKVAKEKEIGTEVSIVS